MTKQELNALLNVIAGTYQSFELTDQVRDQWFEVMGEEDAARVKEALLALIRKSPKGFAPSPGEILARVPHDAQDETVTWAKDKRSYTITRGGESKTYLCASPREKWEEQKAMYAKGMVLIRRPHPRGWIRFYAPIEECFQKGAWGFGEERLPRHEMK